MSKKIVVISTSEIRSGESNGKPWTLYEVVATDAEGHPIDQQLRSFEPLQGEVDVDVERQEHEKYGTSFMLKRAGGARGGSGGLGKAVDELRTRVEALEDALTKLQRQAEELARAATPAPAAPARDREDIPF